MYKLDKGIFLEDQNVLLKLGKPIENNDKLVR